VPEKREGSYERPREGLRNPEKKKEDSALFPEEKKWRSPPLALEGGIGKKQGERTPKKEGK